jgi:putative peptidoglycan lipid II flippase
MLVRSVATIGGLTFLSRIFGLVRDNVIARFLGVGILTDAFFIAFKIPNFLRRLFAEGAFSAAFVPMYAEKLARDGKASAQDFASEAFSALAMILLVVTAIFELAMPLWVMVLAPGFASDPGKYELTVALTRITFPYLIFISLVALMSGILNSLHKFSAAAAAPTIMNLVMIAGLLGLKGFTETPAHALAWGVFASGLAQMLWLWWYCRREDTVPRWVRPRITSDVKRLLKLAAPVALGASVAQINLLVDSMIASTMEGAVSYLYYADRINELPLGVIGIAIGTALLPMLSKQFKTGAAAEAHATLNRALELALILALPAAAALMVLAYPIVSVIYEHGAFTAADSRATAATLMAFSAGLPAFVAVKVFAPGFFARQDTKTPVKIGVLCMVSNIVLNLALMGPLAYVGMALATTLSGWLNVGLMAWVLYKQGHFVPDTQLKQRLIRTAGAVAGMVGVVLFCESVLGSLLAQSVGHRVMVVGVYVSAGMASYGTLLLLLRVITPREIKAYLRGQ